MTRLNTLTVGELMEKLASYPKDLPVLATWEGIYRGVAVNGLTNHSYYSQFLELDAEGHAD